MAESTALHVVIDGRELVGRPTGVGRYLLGLLTEWARGFVPHRITVIVPGAVVPAELAALGPRIAVENVATSSTGTWFEQTALPAVVRRLNADVFLAPAYTAPLRLSCPFVVVIHDVSFFAHPEWFRWREGLRRRWLTRGAARKAGGIITVSEYSATELQRCLGLARARIDVASQGPPPDVPGEIAPVADRPRLVLYAGSIFARRGVPDLIDAFAGVVRVVPDAQLVLVGDNRSTPPINPDLIAAAAGVADHVQWRRYVPDTELRALYGRARVFAFLSEYEGFAMTPMEAIAHGVPVVLRDTPITREVYADGAAAVGHDRAALTSALIQLLTDDRAHADLLMRGRRRLAAYSWATSAAIVMNALERAAARRQ